MEELIVQRHLSKCQKPLTSPPVPHLLAEMFLSSCTRGPLPLLVHSVHPFSSPDQIWHGERILNLSFISLRSLNQFEMTVSFVPIACAIDKFFAVFNVISG